MSLDEDNEWYTTVDDAYLKLLKLKLKIAQENFQLEELLRLEQQIKNLEEELIIEALWNILKYFYIV